MQEQVQDVAQQGRFGDSTLMHMSPLEAETLRRAGMLTINPTTGLPEAFKLKDILPAVATAIAMASGASPLVAAGVSGATTAATAGLGGEEIADVAGDVVTTGTPPVDINTITMPNEVVTTATMPQPVPTGTNINFGQPPVAFPNEVVTTGVRLPSSSSIPPPPPPMGANFDAKFDQFLSQAAQPSSFIPAGLGAGGYGAIQSQEAFQRFMDNLETEEERRKRLAAMYPENIPVAYADKGGVIKYSNGGNLGEGNEPPEGGVPPGGDPALVGGGINTAGAVLNPVFLREANPILSGFLPGFMGEYNYFNNQNPSATDIQRIAANLPIE